MLKERLDYRQIIDCTLTASFFWIIVSLNDCGFNLFGSEINMIKFICYWILLTALFAIVYQRKGVARGVLGCLHPPHPHLCDILTDKQWHWNRVLFHPNFFLFCNSSPFPFSSSRSISLFSTLKGYCNLCTCTLILPTSMVTGSRTKWRLNRLIWINIT